ncbi:MAG: tryptophan synthase subunit alpha [Gammaproteobacteria bacterium]|nr:tryptophan synthase subunit alpha [Gammaproteobacteria bacterium]
MSSSRIQQRMEALKISGRKALIPYIVAGDPMSTVTVPAMHAIVEAGADIIELGMPFSDPFADGPVNQRGAERAINGGMTLAGVLKVVSEFRKDDNDTPIVLMGYLNPLLAMGEIIFCEAAARAGVDGLLIVDMPPEEEGSLVQSAKTHGLDLIYLAAPTTTDERLRAIGRATSGYLYYVSLKGITGSSKLDISDVSQRVAHMRQHVSVPICVGFGIRTAQDAAAVSSTADGSIVGTVLVSQVEALADQPEKIPNALKAILEPMRQAIDTNG